MHAKWSKSSLARPATKKRTDSSRFKIKDSPIRSIPAAYQSCYLRVTWHFMMDIRRIIYVYRAYFWFYVAVWPGDGDRLNCPQTRYTCEVTWPEPPSTSQSTDQWLTGRETVKLDRRWPQQYAAEVRAMHTAWSRIHTTDSTQLAIDYTPCVK